MSHKFIERVEKAWQDHDKGKFVRTSKKDFLRALNSADRSESYLKHVHPMTPMETVTVPKKDFQQLVLELETLRRTDLYKRLLQFAQNIQKKKFTRADLGF